MKCIRHALLAAALASGCMVTASAYAADEFKGVTVNIMTFTGPQIAEPLQRRAPDFEKATGAKINVLIVPFSDLYQKLLTDWAAGTNSIDAAVFAPQWMVDFVVGNYLEDLTPRIAKDSALQENDVAPFFRDFSQRYNGKTYMVTLDGDFQMVYYRTDVLQKLGKKPPQTWDDYLDIAKAAHGQDLNGDGKPDFGSCISKKRNAQAYWAITSIASAICNRRALRRGRSSIRALSSRYITTMRLRQR
jgi:multiple sugar transport system substrate-binding protein